LTVPGGREELDTARHSAEPTKKKKKKKKAAITEQATMEQAGSVPQEEELQTSQPAVETLPPSLSVTVPKARPAKMKASTPESETEAETETPIKAKPNSRPASIVVESPEAKPKRASGVLTPVSGAPLTPKVVPAKSPGLSSSSSKVVSEEDLEAKARPKIGKGPKFEATREEFASDSDDDEDDEDKPRSKKQQQVVSSAVTKNETPTKRWTITSFLQNDSY